MRDQDKDMGAECAAADNDKSPPPPLRRGSGAGGASMAMVSTRISVFSIAHACVLARTRRIFERRGKRETKTGKTGKKGIPFLPVFVSRLGKALRLLLLKALLDVSGRCSCCGGQVSFLLLLYRFSKGDGHALDPRIRDTVEALDRRQCS